MTQFFTQCPSCQTSFKIDDSLLSAADGMVRCGNCRDIFSALEYKITLKKSSEKPRYSSSKEILHHNLSQLEAEDSLEPLQPEMIKAIDDQTIEIFRAKPARSRLMSFVLLSCNLLLLLALTAQYIWYNLETAVHNPRLSFGTDILCQRITCPEKKSLNLDLLFTEELIVRSHPVYANALQVDFIFSNKANFEQLFPLAELSFTDSRNQLLASRQFLPQEYLPPDLEQFERMPANSSVQISLEIIDPGEGAINYAMSFAIPKE